MYMRKETKVSSITVIWNFQSLRHTEYRVILTLTGTVINTIQHFKPLGPTVWDVFGCCEVYKDGRMKLCSFR